MLKLVGDTRFLVLIPVVGLAFMAATLFVVGGVSLVLFVLDLISEPATATDQLIFEIVEFVHFFLIGTVLYITAMGLFQLFVTPLDLPQWLKVDDIEDLELNLVGVVVVVMGVNFLNVILDPGDINLLNYGAGYALPIAALALFIFVRSGQVTGRRKADDAGESDGSISEPKKQLPA